MKIVISKERIVESVLAMSALEVLDGRRDGSAVLTRDESPALEVLVDNGAAVVVMGLLKHVADTDVGSGRGDEDLLTIEFKWDDSTGVASVVRHRLEEGLTHYVLSMAREDGGTAHREAFDTAVADIRGMLAASYRPAGRPGAWM